MSVADPDPCDLGMPGRDGRLSPQSGRSVSQAEHFCIAADGKSYRQGVNRKRSRGRVATRARTRGDLISSGSSSS